MDLNPWPSLGFFAALTVRGMSTDFSTAKSPHSSEQQNESERGGERGGEDRRGDAVG